MVTIRTRKRYNKKEFIFNFTSLIIAIGIGFYFGGRSIYYYSKQNSNLRVGSISLSSKILADNRITNEKVGLHQDKEGYYFKGNVSNNYVKFANRPFRIVRVNKDNSVRLVSECDASIFMWGEDINYKNSNLYLWLEKSDNEHSGVYYDTIPNISKFLVKTKYSEDVLLKSKVKSSKKEYSSYVTSLTIKDYINASGKSSYLNNKKNFWLIGLDKEKMNLFVDEDGSVESTNSYESYGVRPVITLKKNIKITGGDGTVTSPYIIDQGNDTNYVDQYVKLGDDIWKVYQDKDDVLRLSLSNYLNSNGTDILKQYSLTTSLYNPLIKDNVGYYLNNDIYKSLVYKDLLLDSTYQVGEISNETGLSYLDVYSDITTSKIGLLNLFDYNNNFELTDYYLVNTTSTVGSMAYVYNNLGFLEEAKVTEQKHIVPTISISKKIITGGTGTKDNPYIVE